MKERFRRDSARMKRTVTYCLETVEYPTRVYGALCLFITFNSDASNAFSGPPRFSTRNGGVETHRRADDALPLGSSPLLAHAL